MYDNMEDITHTKNPEVLRLFVAISLSEDIKKKFTEILKELYSLPLKIKWVEVKNLHLTLKFIGNVKHNDLKQINNELTNASTKVGSFSFLCHNLELFPLHGL